MLRCVDEMHNADLMSRPWRNIELEWNDLRALFMHMLTKYLDAIFAYEIWVMLGLDLRSWDSFFRAFILAFANQQVEHPNLSPSF